MCIKKHTPVYWPLFQGNLGKPVPERLNQSETMGWQSHQLDHMQIICTSLQTDTVTMPAPHHSIFYRPDVLPDIQPTVSKHSRRKMCINTNENCICEAKIRLWKSTYLNMTVKTQQCESYLYYLTYSYVNPSWIVSKWCPIWVGSVKSEWVCNMFW